MSLRVVQACFGILVESEVTATWHHWHDGPGRPRSRPAPGLPRRPLASLSPAEARPGLRVGGPASQARDTKNSELQVSLTQKFTTRLGRLDRDPWSHCPAGSSISMRQASLSRATKQLMPTPRGRRPPPTQGGGSGLYRTIRLSIYCRWLALSAGHGEFGDSEAAT